MEISQKLDNRRFADFTVLEKPYNVYSSNSRVKYEKEKTQLKVQNACVLASFVGFLSCNRLFKKIIPEKLKFNLNDIKALASEMFKKNKFDSEKFAYHFVGENTKISDLSGNDITSKIKKTLNGSSFLSYDSKKATAMALEGRSVEILHELGHSVSFKKFGAKYAKIIEKLPYLSILIGLLPIVSPPDDSNKNKNLIQKTSNFMKHNVVLCSFLTGLPLLVEEFVASKRALSVIKASRSDLYLKALKYFSPAFGTYLFNRLQTAFLVGVIANSANLLLSGRTKSNCESLNQKNNAPKKIAVIDMFQNKTINLDWDCKADLVHGNVVERFIKEGLPNAKIDTFDLRPKQGNLKDFEDKSLAETLDKIVKSKEKYDAINLSLSYDMSFESLSKLMGKEITPENFAQNRAQIKDWFSKIKTNEVGESLKNIINSIDSLTANGTKVYIGAGNSGKKVFNLYSIADNVVVVGANDRKGKKAKFSSNNSVVNRWEKGVFYPKRMKDSNGIYGFDYTEDGNVDIPLSETSSFVKLPLDLHGTSFSTPIALVKDMQS